MQTFKKQKKKTIKDNGNDKKNKQEKKNINKGTGAGGAQTNINGYNFENKTSMEETLIKDYDFNKENNYLKKEIDDTTYYFLNKGTLGKFLKEKYNLKNINKKPDECMIIIDKNKNFIMKILEKKIKIVKVQYLKNLAHLIMCYFIIINFLKMLTLRKNLILF